MVSQTVADDDKPSPLLSVPLEVLLNVTYHLTTPEYGHLRLTCKHLEATLLASFSREFFTKRQFMFTGFSLQTLLDISKSRFSSTLNHVIFGLEQPASSPLPPQSTNQTAVDPHFSAQRNRLLQEYVDCMTLLNTSQDFEMLAEAFSNLGNLETVGMRDFNSRSRRRDYPNTEWKSYGVRTFEAETGTRITMPRQRHVFGAHAATSMDLAAYLSRIFLNILRALGKASSRPRHFEVILRHNSLHDHAFNLPKYVEPIVDPVLANLRTLFLDLNWEFPPTHIGMGNVPTPCPSYLLRRFLSKLTDLEHLRINFELHPAAETNDLLSWLSKPLSAVDSNTTSGTSLSESPRPVHFAKLRQLDIGMAMIEPKFLLAIIRKYQATLRAISFHKVSLLQAVSAQPGSRVNIWAQLFGQLSKLNLNLSAINMSSLSQEQPGKRHFLPVSFKDTRDPMKKMWAGTDTQSGFRDYTDLVVVDGLDDDTESSHNYGSHEDDSDDSMDDDDDDDDDDDNDEVEDEDAAASDMDV